MKKKSIFESKWIRMILYAAIGAFIGFIYYNVIGCSSGNCVITSDVYSTMEYFAFFGLWMGYITGGGCCCGNSCSTNSSKKSDDIKPIEYKCEIKDK